MVSGVALTSYLDSIEFGEETEMLETTVFTNRSKTYAAGLTDGTVDIAGKYDPTTVTGPQFILKSLKGANHTVPVIHYPGGAAVGQVVRNFNALLASYNETSEVGGMVMFNASLQISGDVTVTVSGL